MQQKAHGATTNRFAVLVNRQAVYGKSQVLDTGFDHIFGTVGTLCDRTASHMNRLET